MERCPWPGALPLALGDDGKGGQAPGVVQARLGIFVIAAT